MAKAVSLIGILILIGGICGILFVTIPSIYAIGNGVESVVEGDSSGISGAIVGGILLYFTTVVFIFLILIGLVITILGITE